ncbi:histone-lysine N-methyltransferase SETMAR-like protein [Plakobranchus ocellatus]|uniref:Histone-lysine N-methyltransferase SETMAR-like protein n=1 Tax=Plakobranchus ocellatus TaxID=259542 RepID=A0AAV3Z3W9_9GAST|nr:histone-lysine N-methyltransferase SETMAR-like protein [Plakobranchus ocellatus]
MVISGFQALLQTRAPVTELKPATEESQQISGRIRYPLCHQCLGKCVKAVPWWPVCKWVRIFKGEDPRETILRDRKHLGRPLSASVTAHREKVYCMIRANRRVKQKEIAYAVGILKERVHHIVTTVLGYRKVSALWVPRQLTVDESTEKGHVYSALRAFNCLHSCMNICSRKSLSCQKLDNRALFD